METRTVTTLEELALVAKRVLALCDEGKTANVLALSGDLGAGKTAFVKELAKLLGVAYEITSPTFVVMKSYPIPTHDFLKTLTHIDAYRVESEDEMRVLGFEALLTDPTRIVCIEWPEKIQNLIPKNAIRVQIEIKAGEIREIHYGS